MLERYNAQALPTAHGLPLTAYASPLNLFLALCLAIFCLLSSAARGEVPFTDLNRFVLGTCGEVEEALLGEGTRKVVPRAGEGRVAIFGSGSGGLRREVYVVCYGDAEFRSQPTEGLNGRVAAILIRYVELIDDLETSGTVYDNSHLAAMGRSVLGLYTRKEMPDYFRVAPFQFAAVYSNGLGEFRAAGLTRTFAASQWAQGNLEMRVRWRSYGYQDRMQSPQVYVVSDFFMGPKAGRALPYSWADKDLGPFALSSLKAWVQELLSAGR